MISYISSFITILLIAISFILKRHYKKIINNNFSDKKVRKSWEKDLNENLNGILKALIIILILAFSTKIFKSETSINQKIRIGGQCLEIISGIICGLLFYSFVKDLNEAIEGDEPLKKD